MTPKIFFGEWYEDEKTDSAFIEVTGISSVIVDMKVFLIASNQLFSLLNKVTEKVYTITLNLSISPHF